MSEIILLVDVSYIAHRTLNVLQSYSNKTKTNFLSKEQDQHMFIRKMVTDMLYSFNNISTYDKLILAKDDKSWRKDVYSEYKGKRTKDIDVDWTGFYNCINECCELFKKEGAIVSQIKGAEGDDVISLYTKYYKDSNCIIITADKDLRQLVNFTNNSYTIIYDFKDKSKNIIAKKGLLNILNETVEDQFNNLFSTSILVKDPLSLVKDLINNDNVNLIEIDTEYLVLEKTFCGDDGDNVLSSYRWLDVKNKTVRITPKFIKKISEYIYSKYNNYKITNIFNDDVLYKKIHAYLEDTTKTNIDKELLLKNLKNNYRLVALENELLPEYIIKEFNSNIEKYKDKKTKIITKSIIENSIYNESNSVLSNVFSM